MKTPGPDWEARVAALWEGAQSLPPEALVSAADALSGELDPDDSRGLFERACARDTLRILGRLEESEELLAAELDRHLQAGQERALHDEARAARFWKG